MLGLCIGGVWSGKVLSPQDGIRMHAPRACEDNELLPLYVEVGDCVFPEAGSYNFEVYFSPRGGAEALKAEHPFAVFSREE
jgi:hypothetical protein